MIAWHRTIAVGAVVGALAAGSCGADHSTVVASKRLQLSAVSLTAVAASQTDLQVATVNGRPVFASCIALQAKTAGDSASALQQCINIELLAQEAEKRYSTLDVAQEFHETMVNRFVGTEFEQRFRSADDLPDHILERALAASRWRMDRADYRGSYFARIAIDKSQIGTMADANAKLAAQRLRDLLGDGTGLFPRHLREAAAKMTGTKVEINEVALSDEGRLIPSYANPLFALKQIGDVTDPVRTDYGWDVILFTEQLPPRKITEDELKAEIFPALRRSYFTQWVDQISRQLAVKVSIDPNAERLLDPGGAQVEDKPNEPQPK